MRTQNIYGGRDPQDIAAYSVAEAAKYLKIPPTTLRPWVAGRSYLRRQDTGFFPRLIVTPADHPPRLSFHNLVEAYVLRALRVKHEVSIRAVRDAIEYAQEKFHIQKLLLSGELRTAVGELFLQKYGQIMQLKGSGQLHIAELFRAHLERIEWDKDMPIRLYPFPTGSMKDDRKGIVIDARRAFGRPIIARRGISTAVIVDRLDAGEPVETLIMDYGLSRDEIDVAVHYEQAA